MARHTTTVLRAWAIHDCQTWHAVCVYEVLLPWGIMFAFGAKNIGSSISFLAQQTIILKTKLPKRFLFAFFVLFEKIWRSLFFGIFFYVFHLIIKKQNIFL